MRVLPKFIFNRRWHQRNFFPAAVNSAGIWFYYKGDEVCLRWFWSKNPRKYVSTLAEIDFNTLEEMDDFWDAPFRGRYNEWQ